MGIAAKGNEAQTYARSPFILPPLAWTQETLGDSRPAIQTADS